MKYSVCIDDISHFHTAGFPGRHELNHGEIDYHKIFETIEQTNYNGYAGLEYFPKEEAKLGLSEIRTATKNANLGK